MSNTKNDRVTVLKTHKLFIKGAYPRGESGRTHALRDVDGGLIGHLCTGSRKDTREAVEAARAALPAWSAATPYLRGQILHRLAEMLESRAAELTQAIRDTTGASAKKARAEVDAGIDRIVCFAGWSDKITSVLGNQNPVAQPFYNFTSPEAVGTIGVIAPESSSFLGFLSLWLPAVCAGNTVVCMASESRPLPALLVAESMPNSDVPAGVFNLITGLRKELLPAFAAHRDLDGLIACANDKEAAGLRELGADNLKRMRVVAEKTEFTNEHAWEGPEAFRGAVEYKTVWHPMSAE
jgi:acyl-CoA reductase-like NAD-dependent aldehyde dehydrogenase